MVNVAQVVALQTGVLQWNQPERQTYQPGTPLGVRLRVANPTAADREYRLYLGLYDPQTGLLIQDTWSLIAVDGQEKFTVPAGSYVEMQGDITVDRTGVILGMALFDVATGEYVSVVETLLEAAPTIWDQLLPLVGLALAGGVVGAVIPRAIRERR